MRSRVRRFEGRPRFVRGVALGGVALLVSVAFHTAGGGGVDGEALVVSGVVAVALGSAVAGRRRGFGTIVALVAGYQLLLHLLLSGFSGHPHHGQVDGSSLTASMLVAHGFATVIVAAVLCHADDIVHAWLDFAAALRRPKPLLPSLIAWRPLVAPSGEPRVTSFVAVGSLSRRGPPSV